MYVDGQFFKEDAPLDSRSMKVCSESLITRKMYKAMQRNHLTTVISKDEKASSGECMKTRASPAL